MGCVGVVGEGPFKYTANKTGLRVPPLLLKAKCWDMLGIAVRGLRVFDKICIRDPHSAHRKCSTVNFRPLNLKP